MASNELYTLLQSFCESEASTLECWVDGASVQLRKQGGFFCSVALPGRLSARNDQLAPLLQLVAASLMANEPVGLAYDSQHQCACLVRYLGVNACATALEDAVESLANHQAAWALVIAEGAVSNPVENPSIRTPLGIGLLHRALMNG
jgi:hypothetical protein